MDKSLLSVNDSNRWTECSASPEMGELFPRPEGDSPHMLEGVAAKWLAIELLRDFKGEFTLHEAKCIGMQAPNGVVIDKEMYQCATDFTTDVFKYVNQYGLLRSIEIGEHIDMSCIFPGVFGYCDAYVYNTKINELVVWQFTYRHRCVEVYEHNPLIMYAAGILDKLAVNGFDDQRLNVRLKVFQPRHFHRDGPSREWELLASDLRGYINRIEDKAHATQSEDKKCAVSQHCINCPASHSCGAIRDTSFGMMDFVSSCHNGSTLKGDNLGNMLRLVTQGKKLFEELQNSLSAQVTAELEAGAKIGNYHTEQQYGHRRWSKDIDAEEVIMMGDLLGVDIRKPVQLDTPAQCLKKGIDKDVIYAYSEVPMTRKALVTDEGKKARQAFRGI